ncbi:amino acid ABC transporter permease [Agrobacterium vitis]|uniref:amino acid ABC transporter permease n=1 Tax=Rhizobium/Agrobacterium group TaxID=227290 RepID=UPI0012E97AED|nr:MULTISPECIES: amino acid ABC transporter permease [Rhizobium/Agrobacterium group]MCF1464724.1 amino acid ABC transporter permease [Allorhizobium ampelinum]MCF1485144.1 amino acid ABC transporter permease [Allorhizobium ampelinum]MVA52766.1 ABC transporter permease subunit [Agrobacterium vitis]
MPANFFTAFQVSDLWYLGEAGLNTLLISAVSIALGTVLGILFGWMLQASRWYTSIALAFVLDVFRSVPLIIQLILFFNFVPLFGIRINPFEAGCAILTLYTSALVANVARAGIEAVGQPMRRASRSLGMSYWQDMRYVVWPIGLRAVLPSWVGVALGVIKDSALVSVLGYVELLRASQILMTRTQEPFIILTIAGLFYFALSYPLSRAAARFEESWNA